MDRSWLKAWIAALLACSLLVGAYEWLVRSRGYALNLQDDMDLLSMQYEPLKLSPDAIALFDASRIASGVDPALLSRELGGRPIAMLAVNGRYPLAALRALADFGHFAGSWIVGIHRRGMARGA